MMVTRCAFDHICMEKARYKFFIIIITIIILVSKVVPKLGSSNITKKSA